MSVSAQAQTIAPGELVEGVQTTVAFSVTPEQMQQFAELSGDFNPLHTDEEFARGKGFAGRVVYGALIVAKVSQLIGMRLPGRDRIWVSLSLEFRKPLYLGEPAEVKAVVTSVSESTGMVRLNLTVRAAGRLLARGGAEVMVGP